SPRSSQWVYRCPKCAGGAEGGRQSDHHRARSACAHAAAEVSAIRRRGPMGALRYRGLRTARVRRCRSAEERSAALLGAVRRLSADQTELKTHIRFTSACEYGRHDFYVDTWVRSRDADVRPGSDVEHIGALIRAKAYHMPAAMMYVSLVHLLDQQKRKELMIIYGEDIAATGLTASDL